MRPKRSGQIVMLEELIAPREKLPGEHAPASAITPAEPALEHEPCFDYLFEPYDADVAPGALRTSCILFESFALAGVETTGLRVFRAMTDHFGTNRLSWTIELTSERFSWELTTQNTSPAQISAALNELLDVPADWTTERSFDRASVAFDAADLAATQVRRISLQNGRHQHGLSTRHALVAGRLELESVTTFHSALDDPATLLARLKASPHLGLPNASVSDVLWPQLFDHGRIAVSTGARADRIIYSGLRTTNLVFLLEAFDWPPKLLEYVDTRRERFSHVRWDAGFEFLLDPARQRSVRQRSTVHGPF